MRLGRREAENDLADLRHNEIITSSNVLQRLAGRANEVAQDGDVGAVSANASGVNGKTEALGEIKVDPSVIEFRQTEAGSGLYAIYARGIDRPRRTATVPGAAGQFVELLPIALVPSVHDSIDSDALHLMRRAAAGFVLPRGCICAFR